MARSQTYPTSNLPTAVRLIRLIWDERQQKQMTLEEVTQAIGHQGISGPARSKVSALKQYGFLDDLSGSTLRLSGRAMAVLHKEGRPQEYESAVLAAFNAVELFVELRQDYPDASEGAIMVSLLNDHQFTESGARTASQSFLASLEFVKATGGGKISHDPKEHDPPPKAEHGMKQETSTIGQEMATLTWPITRTQVEWEDLDYWLKGVLRKAERDIGAETDDQPSSASSDETPE